MENENTNTNVGAETSTENEGAAKTYTEEEVLKLVQSEADKRVTQALNKQKKEYEKKLSLSQLDAGARENAEKDIKIQELEEKLKEFTILQNKAEITKVLGARGLNAQFADIIEIGDDVEEAQQRIETLDKLFKAAVAEEVKKRLAGTTPKDTNNASGEITKEQFLKMTLAQRSKLFADNPELFSKLSK